MTQYSWAVMPFLLDVFQIPWPETWAGIRRHLPSEWAVWAHGYREYWTAKGTTYPLHLEDFPYHLPGAVQDQFIAPLNREGAVGPYLLHYLQRLPVGGGDR